MGIDRVEYEAKLREVARRDGAAGAAPSPVVEGWRDGVLTVFVPGTPTNMKNKVGHWSKRHRWAKSWRERAATALLAQMPESREIISGRCWAGWREPSSVPKVVTFTIYGRSRFDDDNAALVCSPVRDSLADMRVIDNDGNVAHRFVYEQAKPTRSAGAIHGIAVRIALKGDAE